MNAIFFDIDGVLNSSRSILAPTYESRDNPLRDLVYGAKLPYVGIMALSTVDPIAVGLLNRLIRESEALVILCSSHREFMVEDSGYGSLTHILRLNKYLEDMHIRGGIDGVTPVLHGPRGLEVQAYVIEHEIENYIILDDSSDFLPGQPHIKVDPAIGLSAQNYYEACKLLGIAVSPILTIGG